MSEPDEQKRNKEIETFAPYFKLVADIKNIEASLQTVIPRHKCMNASGSKLRHMEASTVLPL